MLSGLFRNNISNIELGHFDAITSSLGRATDFDAAICWLNTLIIADITAFSPPFFQPHAELYRWCRHWFLHFLSRYVIRWVRASLCYYYWAHFLHKRSDSLHFTIFHCRFFHFPKIIEMSSRISGAWGFSPDFDTVFRVSLLDDLITFPADYYAAEPVSRLASFIDTCRAGAGFATSGHLLLPHPPATPGLKYAGVAIEPSYQLMIVTPFI